MHSIKLEKRGVPTAPLSTDVFAPVVKKQAKLVGNPYLRIVFVPQPVSRLPAAKCREYVEGNDPITGRPVVVEITEALTKPLTGEERRKGREERAIPRFIGPDTEENLHQYFMENKMTDFLPIVLPTEERVAEMLKGTSHKADEVVGEMRSAYEALSFTVEQVAANAVMAGAKPEYLPVILAIAASGIAVIVTSTSGFAKMIVVNGPIRNEIGMNSGCGALSPFNQANAVIGRAATLMSMNLGGGGVPNLTYWGTQGNNLNYNHVTFAENEEALPRGWQPLHVQKGFKPDESVVSFFQGWSMWNWANTFENTKNGAILHMANWARPSGASRSGFAVLLDPIVAEDLVNEGFPAKESLSQFIYDNTMLPLEEYWQYHLIIGFTLPVATKGVEPYASWLKQPKSTLVHRYSSPNEISVLVVGGRTNDFWQAGEWSYQNSFSIDEWR